MNIKNEINYIILNETFEGFSSIQDRYLNADCNTLAIFLAKKDNYNGEIIKIRQDNKGIYNHYIYKKNNLFYDINGEHSSILDLMKKVGFFDINKKFTLKEENNQVK